MALVGLWIRFSPRVMTLKLRNWGSTVTWNVKATSANRSRVSCVASLRFSLRWRNDLRQPPANFVAVRPDGPVAGKGNTEIRSGFSPTSRVQGDRIIDVWLGPTTTAGLLGDFA